ncbi:MAG: hypothetical protein U5R30_12585 [Deltaproteobacteria bacterium]|nr:hypothetical protein [Deltaproteobacteria bacterium]
MRQLEKSWRYSTANHSKRRRAADSASFSGGEKPMLLPACRPIRVGNLENRHRVQFNYHVAVDKMHYSVPYEYIKHKVDVRVTRNIIEVFFNNLRICSHPDCSAGQGNTAL